MSYVYREPIMTTDANEITAPITRPFPNIWIGILWVIAFFGIQIVVTVIGAIVYGIAGGQMPDLEQGSDTLGFLRAFAVPLMWGIAASGLVTLIALYFYLWDELRSAVFHKVSAKSLVSRSGAIGLHNWSKLPLANTVIISGAVLFAVYLFNYLYGTYVIPDIDSQQQTTELINAVPKTPLNWALLFLAIAILPGITEELVFRGLLQNSIAHYMKPAYAIALSSGVFAAVHFQPAAFPALMSLGAAFGYIYHRTGSLRINILLHAFNNGLALILNQMG